MKASQVKDNQLNFLKIGVFVTSFLFLLSFASLQYNTDVTELRGRRLNLDVYSQLQRGGQEEDR